MNKIEREKWLTLSRLRNLLKYDPESGRLIWLDSRRGAVKIGSVAGYTDDKGYICVTINGIDYRAHRLIWFYVTGKWPENDIDHRDLNRSNNKWNNLRKCVDNQNTMNAPRYKNNTSGMKGVTYAKRTNKYRARFGGGGCHHLGYFDTKEEAHAAYCKAVVDYIGEFARVE